MKTVKIAELKNKLSEHLRAVEAGEEVVVTDRNRPIAKIVPYSLADERVRIIPAKRPFAPERDKERTPANWGINSTQLLEEERGER